MNKWRNDMNEEWMNDRMNEWLNEWLKEWLNVCMHEWINWSMIFSELSLQKRSELLSFFLFVETYFVFLINGALATVLNTFCRPLLQTKARNPRNRDLTRDHGSHFTWKIFRYQDDYMFILGVVPHVHVYCHNTIPIIAHNNELVFVTIFWSSGKV